jgi:hypothetical protein
MPDPAGYGSHLSSESAAFLIALPRRQQRLVLDLADQIATHPFKSAITRLRTLTTE